MTRKSGEIYKSNFSSICKNYCISKMTKNTRTPPSRCVIVIWVQLFWNYFCCLTINVVATQGTGRYAHIIWEGKEEPCGTGWKSRYLYPIISYLYLPKSRAMTPSPVQWTHLVYRFGFLNTIPHKRKWGYFGEWLFLGLSYKNFKTNLEHLVL